MVGIKWWSISSAQGFLKSLQQKPNLWTGINSPATVAKPSENGSKKERILMCIIFYLCLY
jgi:hypothetical protein